MTVRYAHLAPENLRSAVNLLDEREKRLHSGDSEAKKEGLQAVTP
jgi:hypothetical protein